MSFNPDTHNKLEKQINTVRFISSVWMKNHITLQAEKDVCIILNVQTGHASTMVVATREDVEALIEMLQLTLDNIKCAEIELLALQTKAAA